MSKKTAEIKARIVEARKKGDIKTEIRLSQELILLRNNLKGTSQNYSVKDAYGAMSDSP